MEYRIKKDDIEPPIYWVEKLVNGEWQRVFGTADFDAGESWANVTQEEVAVLFQGERRDVNSRLRDKVWSEWARVEYQGSK